MTTIIGKRYNLIKVEISWNIQSLFLFDEKYSEYNYFNILMINTCIQNDWVGNIYKKQAHIYNISFSKFALTSIAVFAQLILLIYLSSASSSFLRISVSRI